MTNVKKLFIITNGLIWLEVPAYPMFEFHKNLESSNELNDGNGFFPYYNYPELPENAEYDSFGYKITPDNGIEQLFDIKYSIDESIQDDNSEKQKEHNAYHCHSIPLDEAQVSVNDDGEKSCRNKNENNGKTNTISKTTGISSNGKSRIFNIVKIKKVLPPKLVRDQVKKFFFQPVTRPPFDLGDCRSKSGSGITWTDKSCENPCIANLFIIPPRGAFNPLHAIVKSEKLKVATCVFDCFCFHCVQFSKLNSDILSDFARYTIYTGKYTYRRRKTDDVLKGNVILREEDGSVNKKTLQNFKNTVSSYSHTLSRMLADSIESIVPCIRASTEDKLFLVEFLNLRSKIHYLLLSTKLLFNGILLYNEISWDKMYFMETAQNCLKLINEDKEKQELLANLNNKSISEKTLVMMETSFESKNKKNLKELKKDQILKLLAQSVSDYVTCFGTALDAFVTEVENNKILKPSARQKLLTVLNSVLLAVRHDGVLEYTRYRSLVCKLVNPKTNEPYGYFGEFLNEKFYPEVDKILGKLSEFKGINSQQLTHNDKTLILETNKNKRKKLQ